MMHYHLEIMRKLLYHFFTMTENRWKKGGKEAQEKFQAGSFGLAFHIQLRIL